MPNIALEAKLLLCIIGRRHSRRRNKLYYTETYFKSQGTVVELKHAFGCMRYFGMIFEYGLHVMAPCTSVIETRGSISPSIKSVTPYLVLKQHIYRYLAVRVDSQTRPCRLAK